MKPLANFFIKILIYPSLSFLFVGTAFSEETSVERGEEQKKTSKDDQYYFDSSLFEGSGLTKNVIEKFNQPQEIEPGVYKVDIYLNKKFIERSNVKFSSDKNDDQQAQACLSDEFIKRIGIDGLNQTDNLEKNDSDCHHIQSLVKGGSSQFDFQNLRLDLTVPQSLLKKIPRGYVNPADLDAGTSIGFINYMGNYYYTEGSRNNNYKNESSFLNLNGGINIGQWQYRQQSNFSTDNNGKANWENIRSYLQRPIQSISSKLTIGQQFTAGRFFSGLEFKGINLATDERMRPESLRGYAPVIRGLAQSNAKVSVEQNGREIYQLTVPPGPFEINDLYPTNYQGNLTLVITEADGTRRTTEIPYAAVPNSLREGNFNYSFSVGQTDLDNSEKSYFADLNYEYGINNLMTINSALRLAEEYQAIAIGNVIGGKYGALGTNISYSRAQLPSETSNQTNGWMADITYSKTLQPTNTTLSLASYRYSTSGYRELSDVLGLRKAWKDNQLYTSYDYLQRSRFQISLSQPLGQYGSIYATGSTQDYRDGRNRDTSLQLGYNKNFGILSLNVSYTRQKIHTLDKGVIKEERFDNFGGISINMPLGRSNSPLTPNLNATYNSSNSVNNYQVGVNGALDKEYSLNYNVGVSGTTKDDQTYNAGLYKRFSTVQVGLNTSYSDQYKQAAISANGAVAIHSGGVTFGQYVGETFALVEAKGAQGASILSSPTSKIDRFGYAILPSLSPYRYNTVAIDPQGLSNTIEIDGGEQRVAPIAGAAVKVTFKTKFGYNVLIQTDQDELQTLPVGADVIDEIGALMGMVGQNGQVFIRTENQKGQLIVRWGQLANEQCTINYQLDKNQLTQPLINIKSVCKGRDTP